MNEIRSDIILESVYDQPWAGIKAGQIFTARWDGKFYRAGGLGWYPERLRREIARGLWIERHHDVAEEFRT